MCGRADAGRQDSRQHAYIVGSLLLTALLTSRLIGLPTNIGRSTVRPFSSRSDQDRRRRNKRSKKKWRRGCRCSANAHRAQSSLSICIVQ